MAGDAVAADAGRIPKPLLRGLHRNTIKTNLIVSGVLMAVSVVAMKYLYNDPRKQKYADFYK